MGVSQLGSFQVKYYLFRRGDLNSLSLLFIIFVYGIGLFIFSAFPFRYIHHIKLEFSSSDSLNFHSPLSTFINFEPKCLMPYWFYLNNRTKFHRTSICFVECSSFKPTSEYAGHIHSFIFLLKRNRGSHYLITEQWFAHIEKECGICLKCKAQILILACSVSCRVGCRPPAN